MKNLLILLFFLPFIGYAQVNHVNGSIYDQKTGEPLPFVNITVNKSNIGIAADIDGVFHFNSSSTISVLTFSFVGYEKFDMPITPSTPQPLEVYMIASNTELREVDLVAGENPAHEIVRKAVENRNFNNPEGLSSFEYTSYNKFIATITTEAEFQPFDTIEHTINADSTWVELDSTNFYLMKFMEKQHLFLMESVSERKFQHTPYKNNEKVIASRISGLKNPTFTLLATQLQSFSFYNDFITVLDKDYLNPISKNSFKKYFFVIEDTLISNLDSTFILSFRPRPNPGFDALNGLLYITTNGWALQNIIASPEEKDGFSVEIQQKSKKFNNHWFPVQINYDFNIIDLSAKNVLPVNLVGIGRTYIDDIVLEKDYNKNEFSRIEVKIEDSATKKEDSFWNKYRVIQLDQKEINTYEVIDSLGKEHRFDLKFSWLEALATGKLRWKFLDIELSKVLNYNIYEGLRLGVGGRTNQNISNWFSVGGFLGYGFKDKVVKYGYDIDFLFRKKSNVGLTIGYSFDIEETGVQYFSTQRKISILKQNNYRQINLQQFDEVSSVFVIFRWDVYPNLHSKLFLNRQNRFTTEFGYAFEEERGDGTYWINGFNAFMVGLSMEYAPNDKYMEGFFGRKPIKTNYPVYSIQFTHAIPDMFGSNYEYDKLDVKIQHQLKTRSLGISSVEIAGGYVWGDVPYSFIYSSVSNRPTNVNFPIELADINSFETMFNNEFISSSFIHFMFKQNFQSRFFHFKKWKPDLEYVLRISYGDLSNPEKHKGLEFKTLEKGYYETGLELNKLYSGLGIGVYYRFGAYQLSSSSENWTVKLTYRTSFF